MADLQSERLLEATHQVRLITLTPQSLKDLPSEQLAFLDMMTVRFGKLQDVIGSKIFLLLLEKLQEDAPSFVDKLNRLEQLGYLPSANWWRALREIRNQVAHDYPTEYETICAHTQLLLAKSIELYSFWKDLKQKL